MAEDYHIIEVKRSSSDLVTPEIPETYMARVREFMRFHFTSIGPAFRVSWKSALAVSGSLGILFPLIRDLLQLSTNGVATMSSLSWEIPPYIALIFFGIMLFYVPFSKYQKLEKDSKSKEQELEEKQNQILTGYKKQIDGLKAEIAESQKHKPIFEIDDWNTKIKVESVEDALRVWLNLQLRFENKDVHALTVKEIRLGLHRRGVRGGYATRDVRVLYRICRLSSNGVEMRKDMLEGGLVVAAREVTPLYMIEAYIDIVGDEEIKTAEDIEGLDCIRVIMESSGNQPDLTVDFIPSWQAAMRDEGSSHVMVLGKHSFSRDLWRLS